MAVYTVKHVSFNMNNHRETVLQLTRKLVLTNTTSFMQCVHIPEHTKPLIMLNGYWGSQQYEQQDHL